MRNHSSGGEIRSKLAASAKNAKTYSRGSGKDIVVFKVCSMVNSRRGLSGHRCRSRLLGFDAELIPESLEPAFVYHLVELLLPRMKLNASLADSVLLYLDVDCGQVAAEDQRANPVGHPLEFSRPLSGIIH
jgi:hypothetical protein